MTAAAGFLFASLRQINFWRLIVFLIGIALVIACGCVVNNYIDRNLDKKMKRTMKRAMVTGVISAHSAFIYAAVLATTGFLLLGLYVNSLTVYLGITALFSYVVLYGIAKRRTVHGTLVGTIAGSMSLLAGYCAVSGRIDETALILFLIMAAWQMPHFYAIAIFRSKEYKAAGIPVLPLKSGVGVTKLQILLYIGLYILTCVALALRGHAGLLYLVVMAGLGLRWLHLSIKGFGAADDNKWARSLFGFSLVVLMGFSFMIAIDAWVI